MRSMMRTIIAVTIGLATLLVGQLAIETIAWWWTGGTTTFDDPLLNAVKFGLAGAAGLGLAMMIGMQPGRRRRLL